MRKVSVIIPIYNVSLFIERCAESLMQQTLDNVEFIFVKEYVMMDHVQLKKIVHMNVENKKKDVHINVN